MNPELFGIELGKRIKLVHSMCRKYIKDPDKADDLAGHVLLRAWEQQKNYVDQGKMNTWLGRMVFNEFVTLYRKESKVSISSLEYLDDTLGSAKEAIFLNKQEEANTYLQEGVERATQCLEMYEERYKSGRKHIEVLRLIEEGLSYREVGEELGISEGTVKNYLFRIRSYAREKLSDIYEQRQKVSA